jgi:hypothetical protein
LLCRLDVLLQLLSAISDSVFAEALLSDEEFDETLNIWWIPGEIACFMFRWTDVWVEE